MTEYHIKEKLWSLSGKFTIQDAKGKDCYQVTGSLFKWFKSFSLTTMTGDRVATVKHKFSLLLPRFDISLETGERFALKKEMTLLRSRYRLDGLDMVVQGNIWDMDFALKKDGRTIATIKQAWLAMTSTYQVQVHDEAYSHLVLALVIALDYAKALDAKAAATSSNPD